MAATTVDCEIKDLTLADAGRRRIEWAFQSMPVLQTIRKQFIKGQPLANIRVAARMSVTTETANLLITLRDAGAEIGLCASNPLSTQDDVAASLVRDFRISTFAVKGESKEAFHAHVAAVLQVPPRITMDDGGDLAALLHTDRQDLLDGVLGGTEETTSGVVRLRALSKDGLLRYPVIDVNDAMTKHFFDNRYGTGQSTIDGVLRATNILLAGMNVVVSGYGWCGRGIATRARGLGANVIVTEVDPIKALEALMDGYRVMSMTEASPIGDVFITVTGNKSVISKDHFEKMKSGAILCNSGHFNVEIDLDGLGRMASTRRQVRDFVEEYALRDGRRIFVLGEGRLINLASAEGHPASVMDMSYSNQALCVHHLVEQHGRLEPRVYPVPDHIDREVARMKLDSMGVKIDRLTLEQERYLGNWLEAT
ncbi:MAG: adenosylhomocysteinase [Bryobacteraceae bacterium]